MGVLEIETEEQRLRKEQTLKRREGVGKEWGLPISWLLSDANGNLHKSRSFRLDDTKWYLTLSPAGDAANPVESPDFIPLYLVRKDDGPDERIKFTLGLKNAQMEEEKVKDLVWTFDVSSRKHGCPRFLRKSELISRRAELAPDNLFTVFCFLDYATPPKYRTKDDELAANFKNIFISGNFSDVKIKVKDQEFRAHRTVLQPRSPALDEAIKHEVRRKIRCGCMNPTVVISIPDCEPEHFRLFLLCLYSGNLESEDITVPAALHVYEIVRRYGDKFLKENCVKYFGRNMSVENVCDVIRFADQYDDAELTKKAVRFCMAHLREVESSEGWKKFSEDETELSTKFMRMVVFKDTSEL